MNYVINPAWFYWVSVLATLKVLLLLAGCLGGLGGAAVCALIAGESWDGEEKIWLRRAKRFFVFFIVAMSVYVFILSQATMIKMMLAMFGTYENIETAYNAIIEGAKYILEWLK